MNIKELNKSKRVIIYCRESRDDFGENYERIETQRDILINFCKREGYENIIDIILDDNVSGTNFKRLDTIKNRAKNKEFDIVIFKDASRLGRNQIESLQFIDIMEKNNIEVLFESEKYNEDFFPLLAWFNEQRAKEDSKKIRRVFKHKMESGELLIRTIYGYKKSGNELLIDENSSAVVKEIFNLFINGKGTYEIATILNHKGTPTPSQYDNRYKNPLAYAWNRQSVYRIITNEAYTGKMIYGKRVVQSYKNKKILNKSQEEWIYIENHHEPIISQETYDRVQDMRLKWDSKKQRSYNCRLFTGVLICGRCGYNLLQRVRKERKDAYICAKNHKEGCIKDDIRPNYGCSTHHITEEELIDRLNDYIQSVLDSDLNNKTNLDRFQNNNSVLLDTQKQLINSIKKIEQIIEQIYDDKLMGTIPIELFEKKNKEYSDKLNNFKKELNDVNSKISKSKNPYNEKSFDIMKEIQEHGITNFRLKQLFNKIVFYYPNEIKSEDKDKYNLTDELYKHIELNGGIVFVENDSYTGYMAQS